MIPKNDQNPGAGSWGYMVADPIDQGGFGMTDSPDGIHFTPIDAPQILSDFRIPTLEIGGIKRFGQKYYFMGGKDARIRDDQPRYRHTQLVEPGVDADSRTLYQSTGINFVDEAI